MNASWMIGTLAIPFAILACGNGDGGAGDAGAGSGAAAEPADDPAEPAAEPVSTGGEASSCAWSIAFDGARTGDHHGSYVIHRYDGRNASRLTRQIAFQEEGVLGLTISFGEFEVPPGRTGELELGTTDVDGRLVLHLGEEFAWQNAMTGVRRPFTVRIDRNDAETIEGSFDGTLRNAPRPGVDLGDIEVEGTFRWVAGCRPDA